MSTAFETRLTPALIEQHAQEGSWKDRLLLDHLEHWAQATPDAVVIHDPHGSYTYAQMARDVDRTAHALVAAGVEPGDVVGVQLPNWYEWVVVHLAAQRAGAVTNGLITIYRDREIGFMARKAQVTHLVIPHVFRGFDHTEMVDRLRPDLPDLRQTIVLDTPGEQPFAARDGFVRWEDFLAGASQTGAAAVSTTSGAGDVDWAGRRPDPNDVGLILFTSGTTGDPKGVMHTHNSVLSAALPWPDRLGLGEGSVIHMASTFSHLTGYMYGVCLPLLVGGTGVYQDVWNGEEFVRLVARHGIEHTSGATPFLHDLIESAKTTGGDLTSLQHFCCMGAPIPRVMIHEARQLIPGMRVFGGWGQTECGLVTMTAPSDSEEKVATTDGRALGAMEVRVVGADGEVVAAGTEGAVQVRGPFLFVGYLHEPQLTADAFQGDWLDTGDLAVMDEEGFIRLSGRTKDIIIRGGENIPVAYVENILYEHPALESVALVALPHPRLQEIACAAVTLREGQTFTFEDMQEFLREKGVAKQYWPEELRVMDEFPRTPSGKIQKFKLRDEVTAQA